MYILLKILLFNPLVFLCPIWLPIIIVLSPFSSLSLYLSIPISLSLTSLLLMFLPYNISCYSALMLVVSICDIGVSTSSISSLPPQSFKITLSVSSLYYLLILVGFILIFNSILCTPESYVVLSFSASAVVSFFVSTTSAQMASTYPVCSS